ncbi:hypothetical protein Goklo_015376 [Gossypium klotzschianum]|uniref:Uncharacterized protein n=1 Tax=Gossypium klotzschianum TaxID=34286 RepID=A0A7J8UB62_9ROSI|nr:hypothetical protein [Gossypium klotzschianum]
MLNCDTLEGTVAIVEVASDSMQEISDNSDHEVRSFKYKDLPGNSKVRSINEMENLFLT